MQDVFSIGDCSGFLESTGKPVLPALAQVSYESSWPFLSSASIVFVILKFNIISSRSG